MLSCVPLIELFLLLICSFTHSEVRNRGYMFASEEAECSIVVYRSLPNHSLGVPIALPFI